MTKTYQKEQKKKVKMKCPIEGHVRKSRGELKQSNQNREKKEPLSLVSIFQLVGYLMRVKINILSIH